MHTLLSEEPKNNFIIFNFFKNKNANAIYTYAADMRNAILKAKEYLKHHLVKVLEHQLI